MSYNTGPKLDLTNIRFGYLTGIRPTRRSDTKKRGWFWLFLCDCGNEVERLGTSVIAHDKQGHVASCGCMHPYKMPYGEAAKLDTLRKYKLSAIERGHEFLLSGEEAYDLFQGTCHYCGLPPSTVSGKDRGMNGIYLYNGIDRVDNSKGYTVGNCVTCCATCNRMKGVREYREFVDWLDRVTKYRR